MQTVRAVMLILGVAAIVGGLSALAHGPVGGGDSAPAEVESSGRKKESVRGWDLPPDAHAKAEAIRAEIDQLGPHPWAGLYTCGDGLGMNVGIAIAPNHGVVYTWHGCLGLYGWNSGTIKAVQDDRILLDLDYAPDGSFDEYLSPTLYRVQWDGRHYLVPEGEMQDFCNDARGRAWPFRTPDSRVYPLRETEREKPMNGEPRIPAPFDRLMRPDPLQGTVLSVGEPERFFDRRWEQKMWRVRLEVDRGSEAGLFEGLKLYPPGQDWHANTAVLTELTDESAVLWIKSTANRPAIEVGTVFSSRPTPQVP